MTGLLLCMHPRAQEQAGSTSAQHARERPWATAGRNAAAEDAFCSSLELLPEYGRPALDSTLCADAGTGLLDLEALLGGQQGAHGLLTGHESDGSGCSASFHLPPRSSSTAALISLPPADGVGLHDWPCPDAPAGLKGPVSTLEPLQLADGNSDLLAGPTDPELCKFLEAACSGFLTDGSSRCGSQEPSVQEHQPLSSAAGSLTRSDSGASSAPALGALPGGPTLQAPSDSAPGCNIGPGGQRKRGRPRRYDTTLPLMPGQAPYLP